MVAERLRLDNVGAAAAYLRCADWQNDGTNALVATTAVVEHLLRFCVILFWRFIFYLLTCM
jgi:hypothetical protein